MDIKHKVALAAGGTVRSTRPVLSGWWQVSDGDHGNAQAQVSLELLMDGLRSIADTLIPARSDPRDPISAAGSGGTEGCYGHGEH